METAEQALCGLTAPTLTQGPSCDTAAAETYIYIYTTVPPDTSTSTSLVPAAAVKPTHNKAV